MTISHRRHSDSGCPCVRPCVIIYQKFVNTIAYNQSLWKFHQIYNLGAVGNKDENFRFLGQKVKSQGHSWTTYLTNLRNAWTYFSETYHNYSLPDPHKRMTCSRVMVEWSRSQKDRDNIFRKCTFPAEA